MLSAGYFDKIAKVSFTKHNNINWLILSFLWTKILGLKVITLSSFHFISVQYVFSLSDKTIHTHTHTHTHTSYLADDFKNSIYLLLLQLIPLNITFIKLLETSYKQFIIIQKILKLPTLSYRIKQGQDFWKRKILKPFL